jgi:hypothetical protein
VPFTPTEAVEQTSRLFALGTEYTFTLDASDFDA